MCLLKTPLFHVNKIVSEKPMYAVEKTNEFTTTNSQVFLINYSETFLNSVEHKRSN